jgi:signal transduction histidine kinase
MADTSTELQTFLDVVAVTELVLGTLAAGVLLRRWRAQRSPATLSAFGVFAVLAAVITSGLLSTSTKTPHGAMAVYVDVLISVLLAMPYLLLRFTWVLGGTTDRVHRIAIWAFAAQVVLTFAVPPLPGKGEPQPAWTVAYIAVILLAWGWQSVVASRGLWLLGRSHSSLVRHRMRTLSAGSMLLAVTLVVSGSAGSGQPSALQVVVSTLGLVSILLFAMAFLVPPFLRVQWRQGDLAALAAAERGLMRAVSRAEVADTIVPVLGGVFGGRGAALLDTHGQALRTAGVVDLQSRSVLGLIASPPEELHTAHIDQGVVGARLGEGFLLVEAGALSPIFGNDEVELLARVATLVDLALQRVTLHEQERASRELAEAANQELETLLYSVSHDLRSPLISVLGYLDVLRQEHGQELSDTGAHYLDRISVNALYMQSLISDLLELSRIGRVEQDVERLDLKRVAQDVLDGAALTHPTARLEVLGDLPEIMVSGVRARQLLTNLVDNALKYGGREDLLVTVGASRGPNGELLLQIADDGCGIPEEYRSRVLRVFERLNAPKSSPGTGIGLAICKRIAESLGGSIVVDGPLPGRASGATLTVTLPARVLAPPALSLPTARTSASLTPVEELA